jgi:hypothetical protein
MQAVNNPNNAPNNDPNDDRSSYSYSDLNQQPIAPNQQMLPKKDGRGVKKMGDKHQPGQKASKKQLGKKADMKVLSQVPVKSRIIKKSARENTANVSKGKMPT